MVVPIFSARGRFPVSEPIAGMQAGCIPDVCTRTGKKTTGTNPGPELSEVSFGAPNCFLRGPDRQTRVPASRSRAAYRRAIREGNTIGVWHGRKEPGNAGHC